ncbi:NAD-dependent epimerase/dehydratase family protein [Metabacillus fastidiosus]|uniref:NAD-dependent epimerase/dehydratase family protein n=1 Tax=Metabacillus fastidiosus TaxID=1458 RepID=A0ABU6P1Z3_9BACI|nr:NAD-dependent epimerase/dehydratase family protein [Metabacillus fastidiosus]MED4403386.1 NAD-dependent epimerase/dehydratase family protein [Metabacillus fastidiosus]MED4460740.1 NAD-dependent epimerase/dehydratase family protein [Metabacillus fastidiosus]
MRVLVTGGYGFIGSFIAEKFYKEGHEVHILDNLSTGKKSNIQFKHRYYVLNIEDEQCEQIFRTNKFDAVIHLAAQTDINQSIESPAEDSRMNVLGLINMLQFSKKYSVSKFVFASSSAVYGDNKEIPLNEQSKCKPISPYGMSKGIGEYYCEQWQELYGLDTLCFRFSNVYGPRQRDAGEAGIISILLKKVLNKERLVVPGDGEQTSDFIYVEDVAEAVFRAVLSDVSGLINLSTNTETSVNELVHCLGKMEQVKDVIYEDAKRITIKRSRLDNRKARREVDWVPKYSIEEGLELTYKWFKAEDDYAKRNVEEPAYKEERKAIIPFDKWDKKYLPYFENILIFMFISFLYMKMGDFFYNIDLLLVYILIVGITFGKVQAILACSLSILLYSWQGLANGREFIALFTDHHTLMQFSIYLFLGLLIGYIIDRRQLREENAVNELELFKEKYQLLDDIYTETRKVKEELQNQILYSEDSVGEIYTIIKKIDSLEPDEVFNGVISVLEQIMKTKEASIYLVGQGERFLRLVSKSNNTNSIFPSSIEIQSDGPFTKAVSENEFFINRRLQPELPMMIAPIQKGDRAVAVICINDIDLEHLTLYHENLFHVVTNLITASITRALDYADATSHERYIEGTAVLKTEYFHKALKSKQKAKEQFNIPYSLIKINEVEGMREVIMKITASLRDTDYIGLDESGTYWMLLSNTSKENAKIALNRFRSFVDMQYFQEEDMYV